MTILKNVFPGDILQKGYKEGGFLKIGITKNKNDLIYIGCPIPFDIEKVLQEPDDLLDDKNKEDIKESVQKIVTTYHPA